MNARLTNALRWAVLVACVMTIGSESRPLFGGQPVADAVWQPVSRPARVGSLAARIDRGQATIVQFNKAAFDGLVSAAPDELAMRAAAPLVFSLPLPDGTIERFSIADSPIIAPELSAAFPEIRTFAGQGIDDPTATARFGWTAAGFHAIIVSSAGTTYIDPVTPDDREVYLVAAKAGRQQPENPFICLLNGTGEEVGQRAAGTFPITHGDSLRTYRLVLAATVEYTTAAGGTKAGALARMVATMNRVNGIYERELAVRMTLSTGTTGDPTALIYNTAPDPYTNSSGSTMLAENQTNLDAVIGTAGYDLGHVFSTGGGGIASLNSPCNATTKARGVTGSSSPTGDAFDVDYVAHEMGHQFGGNHTFNSSTSSCGGNRSSTHAYEVGSGSSIQAYAGICGVENLQPNSNDYFTVESLNEMTAFITNVASGGSCGTGTATGNTLPTVSATAAFTIPARTPFTLTATGADGNGDAITYGWEEFDLGTASTSVTTASTDAGNRPLFRSYSPTTSPSRTFPSLTYILNNANVPPTTYACGSSTCLTGEVLPSTNRTMNFHVTVRDNRAGGGAIITAPAAVTVIAAAGPFRVTSPNTALSLTGGTAHTVTWDVANTSGAPVSTANVRILLSTNGGTSFGTELLASTSNDGTQQVTLPNITTTQARIKVEAVGNIFFDISNTNFSITATSSVTAPGPPTSITGTAGNAQVSVGFTAPASNGGATITGYTVTASPGGATATGTASPLVVTGLANGTAYTFTVTAINSAGTSTASSASSSVTPRTVPGAPTSVVGTSGDAQVSVAFTAPSRTGGAAVTGYTVTASPGSATATGTSSPLVVTGLTNGTAYTFTVTAANSAGIGAASTASSSVTPRTVPGAPTGVTGTAGNGQVSVAFTAPSSNGGATVTGYTVTASPGGATATGASSPLLVTGLTNGTAYTFTVTATNSAGTGAASAASAAVTPATPTTLATQPQSQTIASGQTAALSVVATGTAPLSYQWYVGASGTTTSPIAGATSSSYTTPALTSTTSYWVRVSNSVGAADSTTATMTVTATALVDRYRLYSPVTLEHHYTTDFNEYTVLGLQVGVWQQEGVASKLHNGPVTVSGVAAVPYYRLYDKIARWHHWTTDLNEYTVLGANTARYNQEGIDGYIFTTQVTGTVPWYRLLFPNIPGLHTWTADQNERDTLVGSGDWIEETREYVFPAGTSTTPTVRLTQNAFQPAPAVTATRRVETEAAAVKRRRLQALDLNGDGAGDVFLYNPATGAWRAEVTDPLTGGFTELSGAWVPGLQVYPARLDADAFTDVMAYDPVQGTWAQALNAGDGSFTYTSGTWEPGLTVVPADLDSDGVTDVLRYNAATGAWARDLVDGAGGFNGNTTGNWDPGWTITAADLTGDGRDDLLLYDAESGAWLEAVSQAGAATFDYPASGLWAPGWQVSPADLDADGRTDLILHNDAGVHLRVLSGADGAFRSTLAGQWAAGATITTGDLNADGRDDAFVHAPATGAWVEALSDGTGSFTELTGQAGPGWSVTLTDVNADGVGDLLFTRADGAWVLGTNTGVGTFTYTHGSWGAGWNVFTRTLSDP